ncbi:MAG: hypothetical protein ABIJ09_03565 [Pseudomonadota bacterium]
MKGDTRILAFAAGGWPLFSPIAQVERVVEELHVVPLPFAAAGLVGLLDDEDGTVPLYDLDPFSSGQPAKLRVQEFGLAAIVLSPAGRLAVRLDRLVGLPSSSMPLPGGQSAVAELPERLRPCITGVAVVEGLLAFEFSAELFAGLVAQGSS